MSIDDQKSGKSSELLDSKELASVWWDLCGRAWTEEDPVKLLDITMQIMKFLACKQQRLDAESMRHSMKPKDYKNRLSNPDPETT
jgi:hypothetical protein